MAIEQENENGFIDNKTSEAKERPVCLSCFNPVDPLVHYCPNCGEATGQFTHYLPFINIPWQTHVWGQMWRQVWSSDISLTGRLLRLLMIIWYVPILLIGLIPKLWTKVSNKKLRDSGPLE